MVVTPFLTQQFLLELQVVLLLLAVVEALAILVVQYKPQVVVLAEAAEAAAEESGPQVLVVKAIAAVETQPITLMAQEAEVARELLATMAWMAQA
jgi:hypothetical protein